MQINNGGLDKYGPAAQLRILVAKAEKREREEGKETLFFNIGSQIDPGNSSFQETKDNERNRFSIS
jgi:hypothetical protein